MQRLGKNQGAYFGEVIDIESVLRELGEAALQDGWQIDALPASGNLSLPAFIRSARTSPRISRASRLYLSTGVHGDEPAGPLAMRQLLQENQWPNGTEIWLCPCLNPTGFLQRTRENAKGQDLNRDYNHLQTDEIKAHVAWLNRQPDFDLTVCLHEDWEANGFYVYELNPANRLSYAEAIINRVAAVCPIDRSEVIDGRPAQNGIIRPELDPAQRPLWPEAFYLIQHKTRHSYTLETPSDYPLPTRVAALVTAVRTILDLVNADAPSLAANRPDQPP